MTETASVTVNMGDEVRDVVTGFQGIAVSITRSLHGCRRIGVQPPVDKDGKVPDGYSMDEPTCEIVTPGKVKVPTFHAEEITVGLGDEVIDPVTQFTGIVTDQTEFLNGCVRMGVAPTVNDKDGKFRDGQGFAGPRLKLKEAKKVPVQEKSKPTGGPMGPLVARF